MKQPRKYVDAKASDDLDYGRNFQILPKNHDSFLQPENIRMILIINKAHCLDLDLNGKRPGVTFDGNFKFILDW